MLHLLNSGLADDWKWLSGMVFIAKITIVVKKNSALYNSKQSLRPTGTEINVCAIAYRCLVGIS